LERWATTDRERSGLCSPHAAAKVEKINPAGYRDTYAAFVRPPQHVIAEVRAAWSFPDVGFRNSSRRTSPG
jgi:hypothetical protein